LAAIVSAICGVYAFCALTSSAAGGAPSPAADLSVTRGALTGSAPAADFQPLFVGALLIENSDGSWRYHCSGTLIAPAVVVTAAHCLPTSSADATKLGFTTDGDIGEPPRPSAGVVDVVVHEQFVRDATTDTRNLHDIGLVLLDRNLPVPVASLDDGLDALAVGALLDVAAYGVPAVDGVPGLRRAGRVPVSFVDDTELVAGSEDVQICTGDSGGGAFPPQTNLLAAIVSRGSHADTLCDAQTIFTRVDVHRPWLVERMNDLQRRADGGGCSMAPSPARPHSDTFSVLALIVFVFLAGARRSSRNAGACKDFGATKFNLACLPHDGSTADARRQPWTLEIPWEPNHDELSQSSQKTVVGRRCSVRGRHLGVMASRQERSRARARAPRRPAVGRRAGRCLP
jgi:hypothetical protein